MATKKLYLLSQNVNTGYDTYDGVIVCAESEEKARHIEVGDPEYTWARPEDIKVKEIGIANDNIKEGVILESFHAG
jgi:hypothetical protein